jgi:ATP-dependent RNA helicase RhlE
VPFATLGLPPVLVKGARAAGYVEPTPIQRKAIPIILKGHDLIGAAQAGTGKTAAFILPTLTRLMEGPKRLRALVLTPTRELASKVETSARDYARFTDIRIGVVHGGAPIQTQERFLQEGVDLLVATPARLLELHGRQALSFEDVEMLVLDEADRMIHMGCAPELRRILKLLPETRQTLMFSATMPPELNRVAKEALVEPIRVDLAQPAKPAAGIMQAIYPVPNDLKTELLNVVLSRHDARNLVVFTRTKQNADRVVRSLERHGHTVASLHENRSQSEREQVLHHLRRGRVQIVVATDLAARGIAVDGISHVVNYDVPGTPEDYVHRLGRGDREVSGDAFTLMSPEEQKAVAAIERFLGRTIPRVLLPDFDYRLGPAEIRQAVYGERRASDRPAREAPRLVGPPTVPKMIPVVPQARRAGGEAHPQPRDVPQASRAADEARPQPRMVPPARARERKKPAPRKPARRPAARSR